ncbi:MAG: low affinity iron permease family protein [Anaeromyxobacteraceae bacterium]
MRDAFNRLACAAAEVLGTYSAFLVALAVVVAWAIAGPLFHFSDSWQLVINTGTTVVTFLMVFLIQATQNRETRALHLKVDELIRSHRPARNLFADLEHASDAELDDLEREFARIRARAEARREDARQPQTEPVRS